jgi:hypothetical protein
MRPPCREEVTGKVSAAAWWICRGKLRAPHSGSGSCQKSENGRRYGTGQEASYPGNVPSQYETRIFCSMLVPCGCTNHSLSGFIDRPFPTQTSGKSFQPFPSSFFRSQWHGCPMAITFSLQTVIATALTKNPPHDSHPGIDPSSWRPISHPGSDCASVANLTGKRRKTLLR